MKCSAVAATLVLLVPVSMAKDWNWIEIEFMELHDRVSIVFQDIAQAIYADDEATRSRVSPTYQEHLSKALGIIEDYRKFVQNQTLTEEMVNETETEVQDVIKSFKEAIAAEVDQLSDKAKDTIATIFEKEKLKFHRKVEDVIALLRGA